MHQAEKHGSDKYSPENIFGATHYHLLQSPPEQQLFKQRGRQSNESI